MAIAALWYGATLWLRPLAIPDEGRYVGVAWEMLRSGDWAVPTLNGVPFFHKPPLFYWITAGAMWLLGPGAGAARVAPWLAAVVTTTGMFVFVRRWIGAAEAWGCVAVLATLPMFYAGAQYANLDMLVGASISVTILLVAHATLARERGARYQQALASAFIAAACGLLSKGLIGVALPILVLLVWGLFTARTRKLLALLVWAPGWPLFLAVAAPWFLEMQQRFPGFAHYFFVVQQFQRFASSGFNNPQPVWFYGPVMLVLAAPWSPWLLGLTRRRYWSQRNEGLHADLRALMLAWLAVVVAFFSFPSSKLIGYILPAVPPFAYLIADVARSWGRQWRRPAAALAATICVAAAVAAHYYQPKSSRALAAELLAGRHGGEPVVFVGNYYYDVGFYARLDMPAIVVDRWLPEEVARDSWRRELMDGQGFNTPGSPRRLIRADALAETLCRAPRTWAIGRWPATQETARLARLTPVYTSGVTALWRIEPADPIVRAALGCGETPQAPEGIRSFR